LFLGPAVSEVYEDIISVLIPDPSIVWQDDFDDGDTEGWEPLRSKLGKDYFVNEGVLNFGDKGGWLRHTSSVTTGSWSFDVFIPDKWGQTEFTFISSIPGSENDEFSSLQIQIGTYSDTEFVFRYCYGLQDIGDYKIPQDIMVDWGIIGKRENITGWRHVDITRDDNGNLKFYFDGELFLDTIVDYPYEADYFGIRYCCEGPALDNVVVRNQVIDIQPTE
jgi:hypothetical protein